MTFADLVGEARGLTRSCLHLVADATAEQPPVAVWGGPGPSAPRGAGRHLLSVAPTRLPFLQDLSLPGACISLYASAEGGDATVTMGQEDVLLGPLRQAAATPLTAHRETSLPPLDAIFRFGSPRVGRWLRDLAWIENGVPHPYNENFPEIEPTAAYEQYWQRRQPLYTGGVHAIVGGWHVPWPDGDWADRLADRLLLWTLADAEPWVELWLTTEGVLRARQRIT
jgi:hypothetical protein